MGGFQVAVLCRWRFSQDVLSGSFFGLVPWVGRAYLYAIGDSMGSCEPWLDRPLNIFGTI